MNWYKKSQSNEEQLQRMIQMRERAADLFGDMFSEEDKNELINRYNRKEVKREKNTKLITINLYRNFDANIENLEKQMMEIIF